MRRLRVIALAFMTIAAACGPAASGATGGVSGAVNATLTDTKIMVDKASAASGNVTFSVSNKGTLVHSFSILKTDVAQDKIPADPADAAKVQETGLVKSTGQIAAGRTKELAVKLDPGSYVLICNEPAHYQIGMHLGFTVK